jgi:hypothetical protein
MLEHRESVIVLYAPNTMNSSLSISDTVWLCQITRIAFHSTHLLVFHMVFDGIFAIPTHCPITRAHLSSHTNHSTSGKNSVDIPTYPFEPSCLSYTQQCKTIHALLPHAVSFCEHSPPRYLIANFSTPEYTSQNAHAECRSHTKHITR